MGIIKGHLKANIVDKGKQDLSLGEFHGNVICVCKVLECKVLERELSQNIIFHPTFTLA